MSAAKLLSQRAKEIDWMLCEIEADSDAKGKLAPAFIESLREQYDRTHDLSDKQITALRRWYERVTG